MALETAPKNKMIATAPSMKEYFFPGDVNTPAITLYAADMDEAQKLYAERHKKQSTAPLKEEVNKVVE